MPLKLQLWLASVLVALGLMLMIAVIIVTGLCGVPFGRRSIVELALLLSSTALITTGYVWGTAVCHRLGPAEEAEEE